MLRIIMFLVGFTFSTFGYSQDDSTNVYRKHNINLQLGAFEGISLNYEFNIFNKHGFSIRPYLGLSFPSAKISVSDRKLYGVPIGLNFILGKGKSHFDTGIGYLGIWLNSPYGIRSFRNEKNYQVKLGYRYEDLSKNGLIFCGGIIPTRNSEWDDDYTAFDTYTSLYLSIGYGF